MKRCWARNASGRSIGTALAVVIVLAGIVAMLVPGATDAQGQAGGQSGGAITSPAIQAAIDQLQRSSGIAVGTNPMGGEIVLPQGEIVLRQPLRIPSGTVVRGRGRGTVLNYTGPPDSPAVVLEVHGEHGMLQHIELSDLQIRSTGGGIGLAASVTSELDDIRLSNIVFSVDGVGVDLRPQRPDHVGYRVSMQRLDFINPGDYCIRARLRMAELDAVKVIGNPRRPIEPGRVRALIDIDGISSTGVLRNCWLEGDYLVPILRLGGGKGGFRGTWRWETNWNEPHGEPGPGQLVRPQIVFDGVEVLADWITAMTKFPIVLDNGARLNATMEVRATNPRGGVVPIREAYLADDTSSILVNGRAVVGREER